MPGAHQNVQYSRSSSVRLTNQLKVWTFFRENSVNVDEKNEKAVQKWFKQVIATPAQFRAFMCENQGVDFSKFFIDFVVR